MGRSKRRGGAVSPLGPGDDLDALATRVYGGEQVAAAQARARAARNPANTSEQTEPRQGHGGGQVARQVLFFSTHGGTGATTVVATLATALARKGLSTGILDLDLQFGDALNALNLKATCPISELVGDRATLDVEELRQRLPQHESGVAVLSQVGFVEDLARVKKKRFPEFVEKVKGCFDVLLVDGVRDFNDYAIAALDLADELVLLTTQDVLALRGLAMRLEVFARLGIRAEELMLVLNRFVGNSRLPLSAIVESLRVEPQFIIREDAKAVEGALKAGLTVLDFAPRSRVARDIDALARGLFDLDDTDHQSGGLLGRLLGGRR